MADAQTLHGERTSALTSPLATAARHSRWLANVTLGLALVALLGLTLEMPALEGVFRAWFPNLSRPVYLQESFLNLLLSHLGLVLASSAVALLTGLSLGVFVTRPMGHEFKPLVESLSAMAQTIPPVAVLAIAAPLIGMGAQPAVIALSLYGLFPILQATIAGIESVNPATLDAARGLGMYPRERLWRIELPLALPVVLSGVRTSVTINIGTAAIASAVGAQTLGTPIIIGLAGFNTAYVIQGAIVVGLLAIVVDLLFERLQRHVDRVLGRREGAN